MEMDSKEKLILMIREDVETRSFEVNFQSTGVSEEVQIFFTAEDDETEAQIWDCKNKAVITTSTTEAILQIDVISENVIEEITSFIQKLRRTNESYWNSPKTKHY